MNANYKTLMKTSPSKNNFEIKRTAIYDAISSVLPFEYKI